jgi:UDPglucose 6-dehydrogenase
VSAIAVIGAGYVGLTTAAVLAHLGNHVCCADVVADKVAALSAGEVPILEEGLEVMVREGLAAGRLSFVVGAPAAAAEREFAFLCVPTPQHADGAADMTFVVGAAAEIGPVLGPGSIVVTKSTVTVGSTCVVERALGRSDVAVVSNPEFLREGTALFDCLHPDRIVIGAAEPVAAERLAKLYAGMDAPVMITDPASAEMIKYASNAFLATKVSFANMVANLCEAVGADASDVVAGMGHDPRIGKQFLRPGPGWGGSCLPKDTSALVRLGEEVGCDLGLLRAVIAINDAQGTRVVSKLADLAGGSLAGVRVGAWGLTFKAGTDDLRQSPALAIIEALSAAGARVRAYDPTVHEALAGMEVCDDPYAACDGAAVLVVLTEWDELALLDFDKVAASMTNPAVLDARNLLDPATMLAAGFTYQGIGRR